MSLWPCKTHQGQPSSLLTWGVVDLLHSLVEWCVKIMWHSFRPIASLLWGGTDLSQPGPFQASHLCEHHGVCPTTWQHMLPPPGIFVITDLRRALFLHCRPGIWQLAMKDPSGSRPHFTSLAFQNLPKVITVSAKSVNVQPLGSESDTPPWLYIIQASVLMCFATTKSCIECADGQLLKHMIMATDAPRVDPGGDLGGAKSPLQKKERGGKRKSNVKMKGLIYTF